MKLKLPNSCGRRRGMALVITLILLSVTLIMAVAFLAMSRRERGAVTTATDTTTARLAADSALAAVQAQIVANILATTNTYDFHLLASTNYLPPGYDQFNISNILPRVIVMMTNIHTLAYESRFYLDLNRNGRDDPGTALVAGDPTSLLAGDPEWIGVLERPDMAPSGNNLFVARYAFFAQPVGNALDLNYIYNQTLNAGLAAGNDGFFRNEGVGSWELNLASFLADLNASVWAPTYAYNEPASHNIGVAFDDALSLLAWRYNANYLTLAPSLLPDNLANAGIDGYVIGNLMTNTALPVTGVPVIPPTKNWAGSDSTNRFFDLPSELFDATKSSPNFVSRLLSASASDPYTFYKLLDQIGTDSTVDDSRMNLNYQNVTNGAVVASMETNMILWTAQDFFTNAANRLLTNYTARWLAADSNLYVATFGVNTPIALTNIPVLVSNQFVYSPAVNRLLQLAVNIYDATTNVSTILGNNNHDYPSVFRPIFSRLGNNIFITGYSEVSALNSFTSGTAPLDPPLDVTDPNLAMGAVATTPNGNAYGVPWIIGAKKGFPAFNQFSMRNDATITRKLQLSKSSLTDSPNKFTTSQMYIFSINHSLGCSFWNSYSNQYPNPVTIVVRDNFNEILTNDAPSSSSFTPIQTTNLIYTATNIAAWPGMVWQNLTPAQINPNQKELTNINSFIVVSTNFFLWPTNSDNQSYAVYRFTDYPAFSFLRPHFEWNGTNWQSAGANGLTPPLPRFGLLATNQLQVFILDGAHVIDYVHMTLPITNFDLTATNILLPNEANSSGAAQGGLGGLTDNPNDPDSTFTQNGQKVNIWSTNANTANYKRYGSPAQSMPSGVFNQVMISLGFATPEGYGQDYWMPQDNMKREQAELLGFFTYNSTPPGEYQYEGKIYLNTNLTVQAGYTAVRTVYNYAHWQANDPLVHYLASDLYYTNNNTGLHFTNDNFVGMSEPDLSTFTSRFSPWGLDNALTNNNNVDTNGSNLEYKDPGVWRPDNWDFPTNKFPTPGWLGRVHRGTPWQTVYLKASDVVTNLIGFSGTNTWAQWTGDTQSISNQYYDAINSAPVSDHYLIDLFTTKINDNARHGTLPINVGSGGADPARGLAAWSALFGGMVALSNNAAIPTPVTILPAGAGGLSSAVGMIVSNINFVRGNLVNDDGVKGAFEHISDILRVPMLTEQSPFLNTNDTTSISDELYEWLPQQSLGLLRLATQPRYVVYCYGQALRPAPNSVYLVGGANFGMVTNYQVVAESAARAIVSVNQNLFTVTNSGVVTVTGTNYSTRIESYNVLGPD